MIIPASAAPDVQQAFRDVQTALDSLNAARAQNIDMTGRRFINAGRAVQPQDFVTLAQLRTFLANEIAGSNGSLQDGEFRKLTVHSIARFLGVVFIPALEDAGIVFVKTGGELATDENTLSWKYTNSSLRFGPAVVVRWHHLAEMRSPSTGVLELTGEDHEATNSFVRISLGADSGSGVALTRNGTNLEVRISGGGVLANILCEILNATTVNATTVNATTGNFGNIPATGSNPTFGDVTADHFNKTSPQTYTPVGSTLRTFDSSTVTLPQLGDVVRTLIQDLQAIGLLG